MHERHVDDSSARNRITNGTAPPGTGAFRPASTYSLSIPPRADSSARPCSD